MRAAIRGYGRVSKDVAKTTTMSARYDVDVGENIRHQQAKCAIHAGVDWAFPGRSQQKRISYNSTHEGRTNMPRRTGKRAVEMFNVCRRFYEVLEGSKVTMVLFI
jgi:hypothetical protein